MVEARAIVVFSGAGLSAESGIPTFREAQTGWWARFDPERLASPRGWEDDAALVWAWYVSRMARVREAMPNAGHRALAHTAYAGKLSLVTQNVDDLHERAGCRDVVHLHGELFAHRCSACGKGHADVALPSSRAVPERLEPPGCTQCGGRIRPGVVWFGENLPATAWERAAAMTAACDLMLVVGTSGVVQPAARLPVLAKRHGARIIEVNPQASALTDLADLHIAATAATALPILLDA
ncbi:MAG: NAD-dependent deacylase [Xanthomonadales bacterium]|nr:NAD-dependent deacylase [Xanthomonadales bacterium]